MINEFESLMKEFKSEVENDAYDEELDEIFNKMKDLLLNMSVIELKELFKKDYMKNNIGLFREVLIENNRWEEEYYGR